MSDIASIADRDGFVVGVALDHRDALQQALRARGLRDDHEFVGAFKALACEVLSPHASVVLLDPRVGEPAVRAAGTLAVNAALAMPLEAQGYGALHEVQTTRLLDDFSPSDAKRRGAVACKLLLPFRVDRVQQAQRQEQVAREAARVRRGRRRAHPRAGRLRAARRTSRSAASW